MRKEIKIIIIQVLAILVLGGMIVFGEYSAIDCSSADEKDVYIENTTQWELGYKDILYKRSLGDDDIKQKYISYAYNIGGEKFVRMLEGENDTWEINRRSGIIINGIREDARGFCQFNRIWWRTITDDERFKTDPYWQLDQCYKHWKNGTKFYGNTTHEQFLERFEIKHEIYYTNSNGSNINSGISYE